MPPDPGRAQEGRAPLEREDCAAGRTRLQGHGFLKPSSLTGARWVRDPVRLEVIEMRKDTRKWQEAQQMGCSQVTPRTRFPEASMQLSFVKIADTMIFTPRQKGMK